jgi:hypothetical protein
VTKPLLSFRCTALASLVGLALLFAGPVRAEFPDGDIAKFTLGAGVAYDDNVFRLPTGQRPPASGGGITVPGAPIARGGRGDTIFTLNAGAIVNKDISRQNVVLNANVVQALYTEYNDLNYTLFNFGGIWNWQVGNKFSGQIGYARVQYPNYFLDAGAVVSAFQQNIRTVGTPFASAGYQFLPNWEVRARYEFADITNSEERFKVSNLEESRYQGGVRYRTEFGNLVDLYYRYTDGTRSNFCNSFLNGQGDTVQNLACNASLPPALQFANLVLQNDRTYTGNEFGVDVERWEFSGKSRFAGFLAYTTRDYPNFKGRNFSGPTGNLTYIWLPTAATALNLSAYRLVGLFSDLTTNYIVTTGVSLRPTWQATGRLGVGLVATYEDRDYAGDPGALLATQGLPKRNDDLITLGVNANYAILRTLQGTVYYTWSNRTSNLPNRGFTDNIIGAGVQWTF